MHCVSLCCRREGEEAEVSFCDSNFLSLSSLRMSGEARVSHCHGNV